MKAVGLIVEYNPLHNGHIHHIEQAQLKSNREVTIAIMSGHFLQRGEPAIIDKFTRAKMAIQHGVDLVFELPTVFAIQHSDIFAHGAVRILNELHVDHIIFGSEEGDIKPFYELWECLNKNQAEYEQHLQAQLKQGHSYPHANKIAVQSICKELTIDLQKPNNILGYSYLKAQQKINKKIKIDTIKRRQAHYHDNQISHPIASATSIRAKLTKSLSDYTHHDLALPDTSFQLLENYYERAGTFHNWELYFPLLKYRIISDSLHQLQSIHGMSEGLEYRLKEKIIGSSSFNDFINKVQTKRYTKTRLQRLCVHLLLQLSKEQVSEQLSQIDEISECRLLAMTKKGQAYLNHIKNDSQIKIISQLKKDLSSTTRIDEQATRIYYLPLKSDKQITLRKQEFTPVYREPLN